MDMKGKRPCDILKMVSDPLLALKIIFIGSFKLGMNYSGYPLKQPITWLRGSKTTV